MVIELKGSGKKVTKITILSDRKRIQLEVLFSLRMVAEFLSYCSEIEIYI